MKLIRNKKKVLITLPFEVGQTYITKMQTADRFTIERIEYRVNSQVINLVYGRYNDSLTLCPLPTERLIPMTQDTGEVVEECLCPHCKKEIDK